MEEAKIKEAEEFRKFMNGPGMKNHAGFLTEKATSILRERFPKGTRLHLIHMNDAWGPVPDDSCGTVDFIDDAGQIHMNWDERRSLPIQPDMDLFTIEVLNGEAK